MTKAKKTTNATYATARAMLETNAARTEGAMKDLSACLSDKGKYAFTEHTFSQGQALGVDWAKILALPRQKQVKRAIQFVNALSTGLLGDFDYTHARVLIALDQAGEYKLCTDALIALTSNTRSATANTRGVTGGAINRVFTYAHARSTVETKISNSTGVNGWADMLGLTFSEGKPRAHNHAVGVNRTSPLFARFAEVMRSQTAGQVDAWAEEHASE